jgi:hypothetical protein
MKRVAVAVLIGVLGVLPAAAKPPSWNQASSSAKSRFRVLSALQDQAVLDRDTGLVWARDPSLVDSWPSAVANCLRIAIGGRYGWRLPLAEEMASLLDPATDALPAGHPFRDAPDDYYWTATSFPSFPDYAFAVPLGSGSGPESRLKTSAGSMFCVRGPGGGDGL